MAFVQPEYVSMLGREPQKFSKSFPTKNVRGLYSVAIDTIMNVNLTLYIIQTNLYSFCNVSTFTV